MYEVGSWFLYLLDAAILALLLVVAFIMIFIKRGRYQKEAVKCIRAEILLPTGWSEHYVVECDPNAKSISVGNFIYLLNPEKRRYGKHPMNPFMGLGWLQVPIRIESWFKDISEPMQQTYEKQIATSAEIKAITREIQATEAAMKIQEIDARQEQLTHAISNQPNKMIVYIMLGVVTLASIISVFLLVQMSGVGGGG